MLEPRSEANDGNGQAAMDRQSPSCSPRDVCQMMSQEESGLFSLVLMLRLHGIASEEEQLCHRLGTRRVGTTEILRCAKECGLKARTVSTNWARLAQTPLPAIAALKDGGFLLLGRADGNEVLVQRPSTPRPRNLSRAEFEALWDGRLVLMARRASLSDLSRRFDIVPGCHTEISPTIGRGADRVLLPPG